MALAIQANLVVLRVAIERRQGADHAPSGPTIRSPGIVRAYRETLVNGPEIRGFSDAELPFRLHEAWGRFCVMLWLFEQGHCADGFDFAEMPTEAEMRCRSALEAKHAELHAVTWRIRFAQRVRHDRAYVTSSGFAADRNLAATIPASAFGKPIDHCDDHELFLAAGEHLGMLATLRWVRDASSAWDDPRLMEVGEAPFSTDSVGAREGEAAAF